MNTNSPTDVERPRASVDWDPVDMDVGVGHVFNKQDIV